MAFYFFMREGKYVKGAATLQTFFMNFCSKKLLGIIKNEERLAIRHISADISDAGEKIKIYTPAADILLEEAEEENSKYRILRLAFESIHEKCRRLLYCRKFKKMSNAEMAQLFNIQPESVNNEVYKCFKGFKKKADALKYNSN